MHTATRTAVSLCLLTAVAGCSTMSSISATTPTTQLSMKNQGAVSVPAQVKIRGTSFGNYEFKAVDAGQQPLYGILPLQMKGGHMAMDILFFGPGMFFNLRGAFPFYQIDVANRLIRYKRARNANWLVYRPTAAEVARARGYFDGTYANTYVAAQPSTAVPATPAARPMTVSDSGIISPDDPSRHAGSPPQSNAGVSH